MNTKLGIHIRLTTTFTDIIEKALRLNVPFFQTFFTYKTGKHIKPEEKDVKSFLQIRRKHFKNLYAHGSYWINLCSPETISLKIIEREIGMAKRLEFTHLVLHPGSAVVCKDKAEGIDILAKALNKVTKYEHDISIILENTAHGNFSIGGDIHDFGLLLTKLDRPEKISFCIDTAHAYAYGYDISNDTGQDEFINLISKVLGQKISLIHLNDTTEKVGLKIDRHCIPGTGNIGKEALTRFFRQPMFNNTPAIIELPSISEDEEKSILEQIREW